MLGVCVGGGARVYKHIIVCMWLVLREWALPSCPAPPGAAVRLALCLWQWARRCYGSVIVAAGVCFDHVLFSV